MLYGEYAERDCVCHQQGEFRSFFGAAENVMAIVYLIVPYVRWSVAGEKQDTSGKNLFQTFTLGLVLGVSGFRMGCVFSCCFSCCQEGQRR